MSSTQNSKREWRLANSITWNVALGVAGLGLVLILAANTFSASIQKVRVDDALANLGALFLISGILHVLYDLYVKKELFSAIRLQVIGDSAVTRSGISDYRADSKDVDVSTDFVHSNEVIIGINYSSSLIHNLISLIQQRVKAKRPIKIIHISPSSEAAKFLEFDYKSAHIKTEIDKINAIINECDPDRKYVSLQTANTVLRYSFMSFDSRIWIVIGTNGAGRRKVPGFFVSSPSSWYEHFKDDICRLTKNSRTP